MTPLVLLGLQSASFFQMYTWESSLAATTYLPFAVRDAEIGLVAFRKPAQNLHQLISKETNILKTCCHFDKVEKLVRLLLSSSVQINIPYTSDKKEINISPLQTILKKVKSLELKKQILMQMKAVYQMVFFTSYIIFQINFHLI